MFCRCRGVFQALIEKHFPVPNSTGGFDFGNNSPKTSTQIGKKRKSGTVGKPRSEKKFKKEDLYGHCGCKYDMMLVGSLTSLPFPALHSTPFTLFHFT